MIKLIFALLCKVLLFNPTVEKAVITGVAILSYTSSEGQIVAQPNANAFTPNRTYIYWINRTGTTVLNSPQYAVLDSFKNWNWRTGSMYFDSTYYRPAPCQRMLVMDSNHKLWWDSIISGNLTQSQADALYYSISNPSNFISGINSGMVTAALGYTPYDATNPDSYIDASYVIWANVAGKPSFSTVATSGLYGDLVGLPSLFSGVYADLTGKPTLFSGDYDDLTDKPDLSVYATNASLTSGLSGKLNISDFNSTGDARYPQLSGSYDNPTWINELNWGKITNTPTSLGSYGITDGASDFELAVGLAAKYNNPTGTDVQYIRGDGTIADLYPVPTPISTGARNFNTAYQVSATRPVQISVSPQVSCSLSLSGGQGGEVVLEISPNGSTGWIYIGQVVGTNTGSLTVGLSTVQVTGGQLIADLPVGYYWRLRTNNLTGSPTYTFNGGSYKVY
jgi:hypothetical protein